MRIFRASLTEKNDGIQQICEKLTNFALHHIDENMVRLPKGMDWYYTTNIGSLMEDQANTELQTIDALNHSITTANDIEPTALQPLRKRRKQDVVKIDSDTRADIKFREKIVGYIRLYRDTLHQLTLKHEHLSVLQLTRLHEVFMNSHMKAKTLIKKAELKLPDVLIYKTDQKISRNSHQILHD